MSEVRVCASTDLIEGGKGHRFRVNFNGDTVSAFVVRTDGAIRSYLNRCSHVPVELDWNHGDFLDDSGRIIVCATHGAMYDGTSGRCLGGPCDGAALVGLEVVERDGVVYWKPSQEATVPVDGIEE